MNETTMIAIFLGCIGLFSTFCAAMNFNWFFEHRKSARLVKLFGRTGTRIFYIVLGILFVSFAIVMFIMN